MAKTTKTQSNLRVTSTPSGTYDPTYNTTANLLSSLAATLPAQNSVLGRTPEEQAALDAQQNYDAQVAAAQALAGKFGGNFGGMIDLTPSIDTSAPILSDPQQYAQDFVTATTTGNPLQWGKEAIYYTDPTSQALQATGEQGAAEAYTNTADVAGKLYTLGAAGGALSGGEAAGTAAGGGLADTSGAALSGGAGSGQGLSGTTLGTGAAVAGLGTAAGGSTSGSSSVDPNTLGALIQGGTSLLAGQQGAQAAESATEEMRRQFDIGQENMAPWLQAGTTALGAQQELMGLGEAGTEGQLASLMSSPGYKFRLGQGEKALEASSAARGGMGSGKAGTAMTQFGQDYASQEYGNRLNQLAGLSGTGQSQSQYGAGLGMDYAANMGNASLAGANARQSGILGAGSALSNWMNPQPRQQTLADLMRSQ